MTTEKKIKHYNAAHVIGKLLSVPETKKEKEGKGEKYLRINVNCANRENGNVIAYGQMRNKEKYDALVRHAAANPGEFYHFQAFYNQYPEDRTQASSKRLSSFFFWDWAPDRENGVDPRAVFILKGLVEDINGDMVTLRLERDGNKDRDGAQVIETFHLFALKPEFIDELANGYMVEVVGEMMSRNGQDRFGRTAEDDPVLPYIRETVKILNSGGAPF